MLSIYTQLLALLVQSVNLNGIVAKLHAEIRKVKHLRGNRRRWIMFLDRMRRGWKHSYPKDNECSTKNDTTLSSSPFQALANNVPMGMRISIWCQAGCSQNSAME